MDKELIIIVYYIYIGNLDNEDIEPFVTEVAEKMKEEPNDSQVIRQIFVPVREERERMVECIYPPANINITDEVKANELLTKLDELKEVLVGHITNFNPTVVN
tara:strand:+ start:1737 stop:2045 length:309 start_codon:yes stop_codon:yes gene_type:complete